MATDESSKAVNAAFEYLIKVSPTAGKYSNFRLEEIRLDKDGSYLITLSYDAVGDFAFDKQREYKDFKVKKDLSVEWMKIRKV